MSFYCHATGKIRYDRLGSMMALAKLREKRGGDGERRAYRCPSCKGWHLTSMARAQTSAESKS